MKSRYWTIRELNEKWAEYVEWQHPYDKKEQTKLFKNRKAFYMWASAFQIGYAEAELCNKKTA